MSSRISVMCTASSRAPSAPMMSRIRSCVSGRTVCTPCCWNAIAEAAAALARTRTDDLREQPDLALGGGAKRAQMPGLDPEPGQLADDLGDGQRVVVVEAAGLGGDQPELLDLAQLLGAQPGRVTELLA